MIRRHVTAPAPVGPAGRNRDRSGHTIIEVALALVLFSIVLGTVYIALIAQHRFYVRNAQLASTRNAARVAAEVLTGELRAASPAGGDLYAIAADSVALRSSTGFGVVCSVSGNTIQLWRLTGTFGDSENDSALVFLENTLDTSQDDAWTAVRIRDVRSGGQGECPDGRSPTLRLVLDRELAGVIVGAPLRAFRPYVYKLYTGSDGRWWLGQRLRYGRFQPVTGPFAPPGEGGLRFEFLKRGGVPARDPAEVVEVRISIRARSTHRMLWSGGARFLADTLSTAVYLRNS